MDRTLPVAAAVAAWGREQVQYSTVQYSLISHLCACKSPSRVLEPVVDAAVAVAGRQRKHIHLFICRTDGTRSDCAGGHPSIRQGHGVHYLR